MKPIALFKIIACLVVGMFSVVCTAAENTNVPIIEFVPDIDPGDYIKFKIPSDDPTLETSIYTEWEINLESENPSEPNEDPFQDGHSLLYKNGYVYTYLNKYGNNTNPIVCRYDANDATKAPERFEIPFSKFNSPDNSLWKANSLMKHTVSFDDAGHLVFLFGEDSEDRYLKFRVFVFDFETADLQQLPNIVFNQSNNLKVLLSKSNLTFTDGTLTGDIYSDFNYKANVLTQVYVTRYSTDLYLYKINFPHSDFSPTLNVYKFDSSLGSDNIADICELDESHMIVTKHNDSPANDTDKILLLKKGQSSTYDKTAEIFNANLMPSISTSSKGDCFGMRIINHDNHKFLVYAKSYVGEVMYNVVLADTPSFNDMQLTAQLKVAGKVEQSKVYERGIRQMVVQEPRNQVVPESRYPTKDYYVENVFYTYAPGASLAKHHIITEEDKIYTALAEVEAAGNNLKLEGKTLQTAGNETISVYNACGSKVAEYAPAKEVSLENLPTGFYLIKCGKKTVKALL